MKHYLDVEFNGFGGELISMALVPEKPEYPHFYEALKCANPVPWVAEHVMPFINRKPITITEFRKRLVEYFHNDPDPLPCIIADWPEDFTHFMKLLVTGPGMMIAIRDLSFEYHQFPKFCTADSSTIPHNALEDARALREYALSL